MFKGEFNILKARKNLVTLDYICASIAMLSIIVNLMISYMIMTPDVLLILRIGLIGSIILVIKSIKNIAEYYTKKDTLYNFVSRA
jgi:hypothetical protein